MPIKRVGKFLETEDLGFVHSLGIESGQLEECVSEIVRRNIQGVFGCPDFDFRENSLNFLASLSDIRQVWFWDIHLQDIHGLYEQKGLEHFGISTKRPAIDFSEFRRLREVVWHPVKNDRGLEDLQSLETLDVWRYKPKDRSFSELRLPASLRKLEFNWCNQESIESLPLLPRVDELQLHYCLNLKSIDGLMKSMPNLKKLVITRCAKLELFDEAFNAPLEHLYINIRGKEVINKSVDQPR